MSHSNPSPLPPAERAKGAERHVQSAILTALLLAVGWMVQTLIGVDKRTAVMETQMASLYAQVAGAYSAQAAQRDHTETSKRLDAFEARFERIERRVDQIDRENPRR